MKIFIALVLVLASCAPRQPETTIFKRDTVYIDLNKYKTWMMPAGDSVLYSEYEVTDSIIYDDKGKESYRMIHGDTLSTVYALKNFKPTVLISGKDTSYYLWGDTIRVVNSVKLDNTFIENIETLNQY